MSRFIFCANSLPALSTVVVATALILKFSLLFIWMVIVSVTPPAPPNVCSNIWGLIFKVEVTPKARQTYTNTFTSNIVGSTTIGTLPIESGSFSFPIMSAVKDTKIKLINESALPGNFQSAEFESFIHSRSKRVWSINY